MSIYESLMFSSFLNYISKSVSLEEIRFFELKTSQSDVSHLATLLLTQLAARSRDEISHAISRFSLTTFFGHYFYYLGVNRNFTIIIFLFPV